MGLQNRGILVIAPIKRVYVSTCKSVEVQLLFSPTFLCYKVLDGEGKLVIRSYLLTQHKLPWLALEEETTRVKRLG